MRRTGVWLCLVMLLAGCKKKYDEPLSQKDADRRYLADRLAAVCDGRAYPDSPAYEPKAGDHPMAIVHGFSSGEGEWYPVEAPFEPKSLEEAQLVACVMSTGSSYDEVKVSVMTVRDGKAIATRSLKFKGGGSTEKDKELVELARPFAEGKAPPDPVPTASASASASAAVLKKK